MTSKPIIILVTVEGKRVNIELAKPRKNLVPSYDCEVWLLIYVLEITPTLF